MAERQSCLSKTRCFGTISRIEDFFIYLKSYKYTFVVILTCVDVATDFWNGISIIYKGLYGKGEAPIAAFIGFMMLFSIWLPGLFYAMQVENRSGGFIRSAFLCVSTVFLFPFRMVINGFWSIFAQNLDYMMASKSRFHKMKAFEALWESTFQLVLNYEYLVDIAVDISPINYISLSISCLSLLAGIFGAITKSFEEQTKMEIQLAGKILITLIVASITSSWSLLYTVFDVFEDQSSAVMSSPIFQYCFTLTILRLCLVAAYFSYDFFYLTYPLRQRITNHEQVNGTFWRTLFLIFQPTLVNLKHNKFYCLPFILLKVMPTIVIHEFVLMYMYYDYFRAFYPFSVVGAATTVYYTVFSLINLLYIIYPFKTDWFYTSKPEEPSLPNDEETAMSAQDGHEAHSLKDQGQEHLQRNRYSVPVSESISALEKPGKSTL